MNNLLKELLAEVEDVKILSRDEVQERIWKLTRDTGRERKMSPEKWKNIWLPSDTFILMDVPVNKIDQPIKPHFSQAADVDSIAAHMDIVNRKILRKDHEPIFIDRNKRKGTTSPSQARLKTCDTYVVDGKHRAEEAKRTKVHTVKAWVGVQAVPYFLDASRSGKWWSDPELKELQ